MDAEDEHGHLSITELIPSKRPQKALDLNTELDINDDRASLEAAKRTSKRLERWRNWKSLVPSPAICVTSLLISAIPLILLLVFSKRLSHSLAFNGCLPDVSFALPYTSSVWDAGQFFAITIPFTGRYLPGECFETVGISTSAEGIPRYIYGLPCAGYTFAQVKIIDLVWDVIVGRCGQAALAAIAHRLFGHALAHLMNHGEVDFDVFATTKFQCGSFGTLYTLLKHASSQVPLPITPRAKWLYFAMASSTAYVLALPTIVSATTGYTSLFDPSVLTSPTTFGGNDTNADTRSLEDCCGKLRAVWGTIMDQVVRQPTPGSTSTGFVIAYPGMPIALEDDDLSFGYDWRDYYERYHGVREQCVGRNISTCPATQVPSWVFSSKGLGYPGSPANVTLGAPLIYSTSSFQAFASDVTGPGQEGVCRSGSRFAWGFSFLLLFVAACWNLVFALVMCLIWLSIRGKPTMPDGGLPTEREYSIVLDAIELSTQVQHHYGPDVSKWSARSVKQRILRGRKGMTLGD